MKTDFDHSANFAQYKTYSREKVQTKDPLMVDRIKDAVNAALTARGWTQVDSGGDVSVVAMEITKNQQTLNTFYDGFGGGWRWGGFGDATTTTETCKVGTLLVDLFDAKAKNLIWRGSSRDTLSNNADKNTKNLDRGVKKMFEQFSPRGQKVTPECKRAGLGEHSKPSPLVREAIRVGERYSIGEETSSRSMFEPSVWRRNAVIMAGSKCRKGW